MKEFDYFRFRRFLHENNCLKIIEFNGTIIETDDEPPVFVAYIPGHVDGITLGRGFRARTDLDVIRDPYALRQLAERYIPTLLEEFYAYAQEGSSNTS